MKYQRNPWSRMIAYLLVVTICLGTAILQAPIMEVQAGGMQGDTEDTSTVTPDGLEYTVNDDQTVTITGYSGSATELQIPEKIEGCPVTKIGEGAFSGQANLTSALLPESIMSIGGFAFYDCSSLTNIEIPSKVTRIEGNVFYGCNNLKSIELPPFITSIGEFAFSYCSSLTSIEIPEGVTRIEGEAFYRCSNLLNIKIPESVTYIGVCAFYGCSNLRSIKIPDKITSIEDSTFSGCSGLTSVELPNSVDSLEMFAFQDCSNLTSIKIPSSVTSIGGMVFYHCSNLTSIEIPKSVKMFGWSAFEGTAIDHVIYNGSKEDWNQIIINNNDMLSEGLIHYNANSDIVSETIIPPKCIENGCTTYKCSLCEKEYASDIIPPTGHSFENDVCSKCGRNKADCIESDHPYENNTDKTWKIYRPEATEIKITFSSATMLSGYDSISIYDKDDNLIQAFYEDELASKQICVNGDTVKIRLVSDEADTAYGFAISDIEGVIPGPVDTPQPTDKPEPGETEIPGTGETIMPDLDNDGAITANDALMIIRMAVRLIDVTASDAQFMKADTDKDGSITPIDALLTLQFGRHIIKDFPSKGEVDTSIYSYDLQAKGQYQADDSVLVQIYASGNVTACDFGIAYDENVSVLNAEMASEYTDKTNKIDSMYSGLFINNKCARNNNDSGQSCVFASAVIHNNESLSESVDDLAHYNGLIANVVFHVENGEMPKLCLYKNTSSQNPEMIMSEIPIEPKATSEPEETAAPTATPEPTETATPKPDKTPIPAETAVPEVYEISGTEDHTASIDSYTGTETELVIPEEINGYKPTVISADAFKDSPVTSIVLPETITKIGAGAFAGSSLKRITITANEIEIAEDAFDGCKDITICCYSVSKAYAFAQAHGINVELLDAKPDITYGDLDGSGNADANDALLILKIAAKLQASTEEQNIAGDVDNSGNVDANDALYVLKKAAKFIDVFPAEAK